MLTTIREATGTVARSGPGRIRVRIIDEGAGSSGTYTAAVLERAATERAFPRGTQMHLDHSTATDTMERPEGSLRNLVGVLTEDARFEDGALVAEARIGSAWRDFVDDFGEFIGVSISAAAEISESSAGRVVERIVPDPFNRADLVTVPGRGGRITDVLEAAARAAQADTTDPHDPPQPAPAGNTKKEEATMADTNLTEALNRASEADRRATEAEARATKAEADRDAAVAELDALKEAHAAEARAAREAAAIAVVHEHFGQDAPAFLVDAARAAAAREGFDLEAHTTQVRESAQALTADPATPTVGAHVTETTTADTHPMSAAQMAAAIEARRNG